jgi:hypothetical protein
VELAKLGKPDVAGEKHSKATCVTAACRNRFVRNDVVNWSC